MTKSSDFRFNINAEVALIFRGVLISKIPPITSTFTAFQSTFIGLPQHSYRLVISPYNTALPILLTAIYHSIISSTPPTNTNTPTPKTNAPTYQSTQTPQSPIHIPSPHPPYPYARDLATKYTHTLARVSCFCACDLVNSAWMNLALTATRARALCSRVLGQEGSSYTLVGGRSRP